MALGEIVSGIAADVGETCADLNLKAGVLDRLFLINYVDLAGGALTKDPLNPLLITNIALAAGGKQAFVFEGLNSSIKPRHEITIKTYVNAFIHAVNFRAFTHKVEDEKTLQDLSCGLVCAIVETKTKHFKLYGANAGLVCAIMSLDHATTDEAGAHIVEMSSKAGDEENHLPYTIFDTDYATTKALVESLLTPTL